MAVAAVVGLAVTAGCGSGTSTTTPTTVRTTVPLGGKVPPPPTTAGLAKAACDLLSRDDVAKALGNAVEAPQPSGTTDCSWGTSVDGGTSLAITVAKPGQAAVAVACDAQRKTLPDKPPKVPVSGVGTSAVWVVEELTTIRQGHLLTCWNDSVVVVLLTGEKPTAALQATAVNVATTVHGRL